MAIKSEEEQYQELDETSTTEEVPEDDNDDGGSNWLTTIALILAVLFLAVSVFLFLKNRKLNDNLTTTQESVQKLTTRNNQLQSQLSSLSGTNVELDDSLVSAYRQMAEKEILIDRLNKENENLRIIKTHVMQIEQLRNTSNDRLDVLYSRLNQMIDSTQKHNSRLQNRLQ